MLVFKSKDGRAVAACRGGGESHAAIPGGDGYCTEVGNVLVIHNGSFFRLDRKDAMKMAMFLAQCASEMES